MSWFRENLDIIEIGFNGESDVRDWFKSKKIPFMQVDIMFKYKGEWCLGEIKTQEKFTKNTSRGELYDGHGLPSWQIKRRMEFYKDTGVKPYLIVKDPDENCLYINDLPTLLDGEHFKTNGKKPRVIFKLENFKRIEL